MSWAARRRFLILLIIGAVVVAFLMVVLIATFYKAPSCSDGIQNQGEAGIDCGGPCPYLCAAQELPPTVLFTQVLGNGAGRTDVIALVENKNLTSAARSVPYTILLYGSTGALIKTVTGTVDLPPGATVPVYVPGILSGKQTAARAFLNIDLSASQWFSMVVGAHVVPVVTNVGQSGTVSTPRIQATLENPGATDFTNVLAIVLVRSAAGDVIAASQTIVPSIPAQGQATAVFTWNSAFVSVPALIEVIPVIPLL